MAYHRILVVHDSPQVRGLLTKYLLAEFSDMKVVAVEDSAGAMALLEEEHFDVILCGNLLRGATGIELNQFKNNRGINKETPLLLIVNSEQEGDLAHYEEEGIENLLSFPISPLRLRDQVLKLLALRQQRTTERFYVPRLMMTAHLEQYDVAGEVNNISRNSLSCEMELAGPDDEFFKGVYISLRFPEEYENREFPDIWCKLIEIKVNAWDEDMGCSRIRVVWQFVEVPKEDRESWDNLFDLVEQNTKDLESGYFRS